MNNNNNALPQVSVRIEPTDILSSLERAIGTQNKPPTQIINLSIVITPQPQRSDEDE